MNNRNLRQRPFLVVTTLYRAAKGVRTERAGWANEPGNWEAFEQPSVVDRVNDKLLRTATIIIDVLRDATVKNRYADSDEKSVREHYLTKYRGQVEEGVRLWIGKVGIEEATKASKTTTSASAPSAHTPPTGVLTELAA